MTTEPQQAQAPQTPSCYRHPGRETYVRCARCDRPICPDCMRDAAVGHQCPDCVRDGGRTVRQARTVFGGRVVAQPTITYGLIAVNVVVFLFQIASSGNVGLTSSGAVGRFGMVSVAVADGQYERLITSAFLHYSPMHILFNMWALYVVGRSLELWLGRWRYIALYLVGALGGSVLSFLVAPLTVNGAGASGAIFGLFAAAFVMARKMRLDPRGIVVLIVLNLAITFTFRNSISWQAHVGGLIAGGVLAAAFAYAPPKHRLLVQVGAVAAVVAVFAVLIAVRTAELRSQLGIA